MIQPSRKREPHHQDSAGSSKGRIIPLGTHARKRERLLQICLGMVSFILIALVSSAVTMFQNGTLVFVHKPEVPLAAQIPLTPPATVATPAPQASKNDVVTFVPKPQPAKTVVATMEAGTTAEKYMDIVLPADNKSAAAGKEKAQLPATPAPLAVAARPATPEKPKPALTTGVATTAALPANNKSTPLSNEKTHIPAASAVTAVAALPVTHEQPTPSPASQGSAAAEKTRAAALTPPAQVKEKALPSGITASVPMHRQETAPALVKPASRPAKQSKGTARKAGKINPVVPARVAPVMASHTAASKPSPVLDEARGYLESGNYAAALVVYDRFLDHSPNNIEALAGKASALEHTGQNESAIELDRQILKLDPVPARRLNLATLYDRSGHTKEALSLYRQVLSGISGDHPVDGLALSGAAIQTRIDVLQQNGPQ